MTAEFDAVVVGGGHNGLVAAAYLARSGLRTLVCERRDVVGGAAVSEHPFGPEYTVTSLSYVVSLLPADLVRDLRLDRYGYHVYPQGPYFAPRADGRYLRLPSDPAERHAEIAKFSAQDADNYDDYEARLARIAAILGPLLTEIPPKLGSRAPCRPARAGHAAAAPAQGRHQAGRRHHQVAHRQRRRPARPVLHQRRAARPAVGVRRDRHVGRSAVSRHRVRHAAPPHRRHRRSGGRLGLPARRDGRGHAALAGAARSFGAEIRTGTEVAAITTSGGRVTGVDLADGEHVAAPVVVTTVHPQLSFLKLVDPAVLPGDFVADIRGWQTRSGTVKINLALDRMPGFASHPEFDPQVHGGTIVLAESLDEIETSFQEAVGGRPSRRRSPISAFRACSMTRSRRPGST